MANEDRPKGEEDGFWGEDDRTAVDGRSRDRTAVGLGARMPPRAAPPQAPQASRVPKRTEITPAPGFQRAPLSPQTAKRTEITPRTGGTGAPAARSHRTEITPPPQPVQSSRPVAARTEIAPGAAGTGGIKVKQFELIRELGRGGMGQVFLARDTKLARLVALKFLNVQSSELTERFLVEARATARCQHENIVVIYEVDEVDGQPYMALEYLEGQPLSTLLERSGTLSARRAIELIVPVVRALVRAHEFNIVHRDLKPDNIFVQNDGVVKVLDFGIAKLFDSEGPAAQLGPEQVANLSLSNMTQEGGIVGTMPYMSPEQWGADSIDHRTDIWAVGIILWEMLTGKHPLEPLTPERLCHAAAMLGEPMPRVAAAAPDVPGALEPIIDRCLAKRKAERFPTAWELLQSLEPLMPGRYGRRLGEGESPFPGLSAFQEADADRFFGRSHDILHMVQKMREQPLLGVVGPSGVGKSSFVRAGVVPALKASGEEWEVLIARPGRDPISGLATLLQPLMHSTGAAIEVKMAEHQQLIQRLRSEPGYLGTLLRSRARQKRGRILLFVDQFEELYTLVPDQEERRLFTACLAGVADDASTPLRVVVSMRSDFLDRAAEDRGFMEHLTRGLLFLPPMDRAGMREALTQPLDMVGYRYESELIVEDMLDSLADTPGALPLLQFTAAKLWESRNRGRQLLTQASYEALGGLEGALATHADEVVAGMAPPQQRLTRTILLRLVTTDLTRAIVDVEELRQLGDPSAIQALINHLVEARLLVVQSRGEQEGPAVELVHESLISSWPKLRRWIDESSEDSAFLEQLRTAAKQWDGSGRPVGLLWRGETMEEARRFERRYKGELATREREYLDAVVQLADRAARRKRRLVVAAFAFLLALVAAAAVALVFIRNAQQVAEEQMVLAENEAERARQAEAEASEALVKIKEQMAIIEERERERDAAKTAAREAQEKAKSGEEALAMTYEQLEEALADAKKAKSRAERAQKNAERAAEQIQELAEAERGAKKRMERLLAKERARVKKLEEEKRKLSTKLK